MKKRTRGLWLFFIAILLFPVICQTTSSQNIEDFKVTGVTVYRVYPFSPIEQFGTKMMFFKNFSYSNLTIDVPWSTPFSFDPTQRLMVLNNLQENSFVSQNSINVSSRNGNFSQNEYISFVFKNQSLYKCIIFPTMLIGIGELTVPGEYISVSELNLRRSNFLSFFEEFIMSAFSPRIHFQQNEFVTSEPLPKESMIWTRIIRVNPNFNYLSDEQLTNFLYFKTFIFNKVETEDKLKMMLSCSISPNYINEVVLFDGYNLNSWKTYYDYPLGKNENLIELQMLTELNYVLLPYNLNELSKLQKELDSLENNLTLLHGKQPDEIKQSGIFEMLAKYKTDIRESQYLDLNIKLRMNNSLFDSIFSTRISNQYEKSSDYLNDAISEYYFVRDSYNNLLSSAFSDSSNTLQFWAIVFAAAGILATIIVPSVIDICRYNFSKPKFKVHFKPALGNTFEEKPLQEMELPPIKMELVWVMIHNEGKLIKDNWFCIIDFEEGFIPVPIEETRYWNVDFVKHYTVQKKYNAVHFNSADFSPLIPFDDTIIFPMVIETPSKLGKYSVSVIVRTGNHKKQFVHVLSIEIKGINKNYGDIDIQ